MIVKQLVKTDRAPYDGGSAGGRRIMYQDWTLPADITRAVGVGCVCGTWGIEVGKTPYALCVQWGDVIAASVVTSDMVAVQAALLAEQDALGIPRDSWDRQ